MKEIEIKAHAADMESLSGVISSVCGRKGRPVSKHDLYFRRPGEKVQALRIRRFPDHLEVTAKKQFQGDVSEENSEYEFRASLDEEDSLVSFFECLGYEKYFIKDKEGFEWFAGPVHVELLRVNDLGIFLEMEYLLDFSCGPDDVVGAQEELFRLLHLFGLSEGDVERRSYREMILGE